MADSTAGDDSAAGTGSTPTTGSTAGSGASTAGTGSTPTTGSTAATGSAATGSTAGTAGTGSPPPSSTPVGTAGASSGSGSAWRTVLPALTFLAGAALATAVLLVGRGGDTSDLPAAVEAPGAAALVTPESVPPGSTLLVRVPAACVEAAEFTDVVTGSLSDLADAARDFDARRLQETLDALQNVRPEVEAAAETCRDLAAEGSVVTASPMAPEPAPSASATP